MNTLDIINSLAVGYVMVGVSAYVVFLGLMLFAFGTLNMVDIANALEQRYKDEFPSAKQLGNFKLHLIVFGFIVFLWPATIKAFI